MQLGSSLAERSVISAGCRCISYQKFIVICKFLIMIYTGTLRWLHYAPPATTQVASRRLNPTTQYIITRDGRRLVYHTEHLAFSIKLVTFML